MPKEPVPAKRSRTSAPSIADRLCKELKTASLTLSEVGLISTPFGADRRIPPAFPATTLMFQTSKNLGTS